MGLLDALQGKKDDEKKPPLADLDDLEKNEESGQKAVTHRNPDKKRSKERMITHILTAQMLPPVTKRKVAMYQLLDPYKKDPLLRGNPTGDDIVPFDIVIPGTYMIYDPYEKDLTMRDKMMRNVTRPGIEIRDGKQIQMEVVEDIIMHKGFLSVNQDTEYSRYVLMELHPLNASNRRRDKNIPAAFERIDLKYKSVASQSAAMDLSEDASRTVVELPIDRVYGYAASLNIPTTGVQPNDIRFALRVFAKEHPLKFFKLNPSSTPMVKINFLDAVELGFVEYVVDKKAWRFANEDRPFHVHGVQEDPTESVVKMLASEKEDAINVYNKITESLGYWETN